MNVLEQAILEQITRMLQSGYDLSDAASRLEEVFPEQHLRELVLATNKIRASYDRIVAEAEAKILEPAQ